MQARIETQMRSPDRHQYDLPRDAARKPYETDAIFNVSAMSYGAISKPAVLALSRGAKKAGIWMNTGEGGLSPWHLEGGADIVVQIGTAKYGVRDYRGGGRVDRG